MKKTIYYHSKEERKKILDDMHKQKFTLLHDTFRDEQGNPTDKNSGELIFSDTQETIQSDDELEIIQLRQDAIEALVIGEQSTLSKIKQRLGL